MRQTYTGGCQCGQVKYEVTADIEEVAACNCSRCGRLGSLFTFVPASDFTLKSGKDAVTDYQFNRRVFHHLFCATCGIQSYAVGTRDDGTEVVAINVRCLDGIDPRQFKIKTVDGKGI